MNNSKTRIKTRMDNAKAIRNHQGMMLYALLYALQEDKNYPTKETHKELQFMVQVELNELGLSNLPIFDEDGIAKIDYELYGYPKGFEPDKYIFGDNNSEGNGVVKIEIQDWLIHIKTIAEKPEDLTWFNVLRNLPERFRKEDGNYIL